jgi:hypothetical protein
VAAGGGRDPAQDGALAGGVNPTPEVNTPRAEHTADAALAPRAAAVPRALVIPNTGAGPLTFTRLKWTSFFHSVVYLSLIVCAIAGLASPTLVLGWTHGILWIAMSLACIAAVRGRVIPLRVGVAVAVLGGLGPFVGSYEFVREQRRRAAYPPAPDR